MNFAAVRGRLTDEPILRRTDNGMAVCRFTVAVNERRASGEHTDFVDCAAYAQTAEFLERNFKKGQFICVCGKVRTNVWEKKDGTKAKDVWVDTHEISFA